jgi:hypothetical protein
VKILFYDKKNKMNVTSDQLMSTKVVEDYAGICNEGYPTGTSVKELTDKYGDDCLVIREKLIGTLGYKSDKCPEYCNWDMFLMPSDLVYLDVVEEE